MDFYDEIEMEKFLKFIPIENQQVKVRARDFSCGLCDGPLKNPKATTCCNKHVCNDCYAPLVEMMVFAVNSYHYFVKFPCCGKSTIRDENYNLPGRKDFPLRWRGFGYYYGEEEQKKKLLEWILQKPSDFFLNKLNQTMFKCLETDCQATVNYDKIKEHENEFCHRTYICVACSRPVKVSDKHVCADGLNIKIMEAEKTLEEQKEEMSKSMIYIDPSSVWTYIDSEEGTERRKPMKFAVEGVQRIKGNNRDFLCVLCNGILVNPKVTTCCNKHVCYDCFATGADEIMQVVNRNLFPPPLTYPCCETKLSRYDAEETFAFIVFGETTHHYGLVTSLRKPSDFFLNKLNQTTYKCPQITCQAIVKYTDIQKHQDNDCAKIYTCSGCKKTVKISDKHDCIESLKIKFKDAATALKKQQRRIEEFYPADQLTEFIFSVDLDDFTMEDIINLYQ